MPTSSPVARCPAAARRWLIAAGLLLVAAIAASGVLAVPGAFEHDWPDDREVATDGRAHEVSLADSGPALIWAYGAFATAPECAVTDADTGRAVAVTPTDGSRTRPGGSAADWVATLRFDAPSETVSVTCGPSAAGPVFVEHEPVLPEPLAAWGTWVALPAGLVLASTGCLAVGLLRRRGRGLSDYGAQDGTRTDVGEPA
ncbi:hypothetical protein [Nocardioides ferulae]|uniref:hypothetical protein n=1 Tax=Nocardioides ferulae TaxID=2340821 RepID=UPI000EB1B549|nr:hypothetical protein [Nocardioides ferulae]